MTDSKRKQRQKENYQQQQQQSISPIDPKARQEELDFLKKNLLKKLYLDLFQKNSEIFRENALTFEQFTYDYYEEINKNLDVSKPDYAELLNKIDELIKKDLELKNTPLTKDINPLELKKVILEKSKEDEWALIQKYQTALYQENQKKLKQEKEEKERKYLSELSKQIKAKAETKDEIEEKKDSIYSFSMNKKQKELSIERKDNEAKLLLLKQYYINDNMMSDYISLLEHDNAKIDEDNRNVIAIKIASLNKANELKEEDQMSYRDMISKIIKETKYDNIQNEIRALNYKKELDILIGKKVNTTYRPERMNDEERKFNRKLLEDSRNYFKTNAE